MAEALNAKVLLKQLLPPFICKNLQFLLLLAMDTIGEMIKTLVHQSGKLS
jgi:hypothetical protein